MNEAADHQVIQAIFPAVELFDAAIARGDTPYQLQALSPASHQRYSHARSLYGKTSKAARQSATRQAPTAHTAKAQHKQHRVTTDAVVVQREASLKLPQAVRTVRIHHVLPIQAVDDAAAVHHVARLQSSTRSSSPEHRNSSASIQHQLQQHPVPCWPTRQEGVKAPQPKRLGGSKNSSTDLVGAQACIALHADDARRAASAHQSQPHHHQQRQQHIRLFNSDGGACSPELVSSSAASVDSSNDTGRGAAVLESAQTDTAEELNNKSVAEPLFHLITQAGRCDDYTQPMVMVRQQSASQQHKAVSSTAASQEQEVMIACPKWASQLRMSFAVQLLELTSSAAGYSSVPQFPQQQQCGPPECSSSGQLCVNEEYKQEQECRNLLVALKGLELTSGRLHEASAAEQQKGRPSDLTHVHSRPRSRSVTTAGNTRDRMTLSAVGRHLSPAFGCSIESQPENTFAAVAEAASAARQVSSREQGGLLQLPRPASAADFRQRWMRSELFDPFGVLQSQRVQALNSSQHCDRVSTEVADDVAACATAVAGRIQPRTGVTCLLQIPPTKQQSISALQESMARSQVAVGWKCPACDVSLQCKLSSEADACRGCSSAPGCRRRAQSRFTTKQERNHGRCDCRGDAAGIEWCSSKQGRRNKQASSEGGAAGGHRWVVSACTSDTGFAGGFYDEETATMYVS